MEAEIKFAIQYFRCNAAVFNLSHALTSDSFHISPIVLLGILSVEIVVSIHISPIALLDI